MRRLSALIALAAVMMTAACAPSTSTDEPATETTAPSSPTAEVTTDPRDITGGSTAEPVPEITPIGDPEPQLPVSLTGDDGVAVTVTDVSASLALDLYGTLTETVIGLGLADNLVGRGNTNTESSIAHLPVVTQNGHELNVEAILSLAPTFVIMDSTMGPPEVPQQLRAAGVTVLVVSSERGVDLIAEQIALVAQAFGVDDAGQELVDQVESNLDAALDRITELRGDWPPMSMAFLYVRGTGSVFFIMGSGSGADDLIAALGGTDAASEAGLADIVPATAEAVLALNPELIITMSGGLASTGGIDGFLQRPGIADTVAGANQRIVDMADGDVLSFGPSYPAVLSSLADAIYQP